MIRISPLLKALKGGAKSINLNNIETRLGYEAGSIRPQDLPQFQDLQKYNPHSVDQINYINEALKNEKLAGEITDADLNATLTGSPDLIKDIYTKVDDNRRTLEIADRFEQVGGLEKNIRGVKNYFKDVLRQVENRSNHSYMITESNLLKNIFKGLDEVGQTEAKQAWDYLLNSPEKFTEFYGIDQDAINRAILGEVDDTIANSPVLSNIVKAFQTFDDEVVGFAQELGVPVGQLDDFYLPFRVPKDTPYILGKDQLTQLLLDTTTMDEKGINYVVDQLVKRADDTSVDSNISFKARNIEFKSSQAELDFYRAINQIDSREPLLPYLMNYKRQLLRKTSLIASFGSNPIGTIEKSINRLIKGGDATAVENARRLKDNVKGLLDAYEGKLRVTHKGVENFRKGLSQVVSIFTGATGLSFTRNLINDFGVHGAAAPQAVFNPNYNIGDAALGIVSDFVNVIKTGFRVNKDFREHMTDLLSIMEIANSADSYSHTGLLNFEDVFDVNASPSNKTLGDKIVNGLFKLNNNIYTYSGQHSLIDFRRFRQMISLQQMWTKNLQNYSYKQWSDNLDDIGKKQLQYLETTYNLGEAEFNFLREANKIPFEHKGRNLDLLSRDSILDTADDIAKKYLKKGETVEAFKRKVANGWQGLIYANLNEATPIPFAADSLSAGAREHNSYMRLLLTLPLKFGDIAQAQWNSVIDRVALSVYGDKSKYIGADRSLARYAAAGAIYTGGGIGITWGHDILQNRAPTDFTDPVNIAKAITSSGFGGYSTMVISGMANLYPSYYQGLFSEAPAAALLNSAIKLFNSAAKDDPDLMWYKFATEIRKLTGFGNMWYTRGLFDEMLRSMLLNPTTRREYEIRRDNARRSIK